MQLLYLKGYEAIQWHKPHRCLLCFCEIKLGLCRFAHGKLWNTKKNKENSCESFVRYGWHATLRARVRENLKVRLRLLY